MWWHLKTSIGVFEITTNWDKKGRFILRINEEPIYDGYRSAEEAASDVNSHTTGHKPWDSLEEEPPTTLDGWEKGRYRF